MRFLIAGFVIQSELHLWCRTIFGIQVPRIKSRFIKSDMHAFLEIHEEEEEENHDHNIHYAQYREGVVLEGFLYTEPRKVNCDIIKMSRALHFSHSSTHDAVEKGLFPAMVRGQ